MKSALVVVKWQPCHSQNGFVFNLRPPSVAFGIMSKTRLLSLSSTLIGPAVGNNPWVSMSGSSAKFQAA